MEIRERTFFGWIINFSLVGLLLVSIAACENDGDDNSGGRSCPKFDERGFNAYFSPSATANGNTAADWLGYPFPADHRRLENGNIRLTDFPNPADNEIMKKYLNMGETKLSGFGANSAVYIRFNKKLDISDLSTEPDSYMNSDATLQLIDISDDSDEYGFRRPLHWEYWTEETNYIPRNTLAVAPSWGFPLRPNTTYALIITNNLSNATGLQLQSTPLLSELLASNGAAACAEMEDDQELFALLYDQFKPLRDLLGAEGFDSSAIAVATVFTTQDITGELSAIYNSIQNDLPTPLLLSGGWSYIGNYSFTYSGTDTIYYNMFEGKYEAPNFQKGEPPYAETGGDFNFVDGEPEPFVQEKLRFALSVPQSPPGDGGECYPIVEVAHGTGGSAYSFYFDSTAERLAARGIAAISIDQPFHGFRNKSGLDRADIELYTFNYFNPLAGKTNFQQMAVDTFSLTRLIQDSLVIPADISPTGGEICFDAKRIGFFGHSQGGMSGSIAAAFESDISTWMLSGAGGGLSITLLEREDIQEELIVFLKSLLQIEAELTELHPIASLVQSLVESSDMINYSPYWLNNKLRAAGANILMTSGVLDPYTPYRTANALAIAGRVPQILPAPIEIPEYGWLEIAAEQSPVSNNINDELTGGFIQWGNEAPCYENSGHYPVFDCREAINSSIHFLETAIWDSKAVIERIPDADVH